MPEVIVRQATYDYAALRPLIFGLMDSLGGSAIQKGSKVVVKPNLLAPAPPDKAVVTHPLMVKAVVEYVLRKGALPQISDSPAVGSFEKILRESGIRDALQGLEVEFREFKGSSTVDTGAPFRTVEIARDALDAEFFINLPKLKTHAQMLLTLGVKNLFGCVVGFRKPEWHLRTGIDHEMFARLLLRIHDAVRPSITVLDGILAMEGQGPGKGGVPRPIGVIAGSTDAVALDCAVCRMLGVAPGALPTIRAAQESGYRTDEIVIDGDLPEVRGFRLPENTSLIFGPRMVRGVLRRHIVQRPVSDRKLCRLCGECWKYCPAQAISHERRGLVFDYGRCIRCYCCIEVCPHGALRAGETVSGKVLKKIMKR